MSNGDETWKPDDSFHDLIDGEYKGVRRVREALEKLGVDTTQRIVTSKDPELADAVELLRREQMPEGFEQWQLPIVIGGDRPVLSFITVGKPKAKVPDHAHENDSVFRIVLTGSIRYGDVELTPGDWMFVPTGHSYDFSAGPLGCAVMHMYDGV